ncbi:hypothetical protein AB0L49_47825, partial [Streptomyces antimycoticus]|uniref:hypothetical protein n=1 Tax=Streptomyces antimycoticus TaxID=68175 RepID=UPI00343864AD
LHDVKPEIVRPHHTVLELDITHRCPLKNCCRVWQSAMRCGMRAQEVAHEKVRSATTVEL